MLVSAACGPPRDAGGSVDRRDGGKESALERSPGATDGTVASAPGGTGEVLRGRVLTESGKAFEVEVVRDDPSRRRGLQRRASLPAGEGMLFVFPAPGRHRFWMYDCLIPLDILWLDAAGRVLHQEEGLPVCRALPCKDYGPDADSLYVLELGAGIAAHSGIRPGSRLELLFAEPPRPR